jgi:SPX domain protein involved in polyphosphate accumulation
MRFGSKLQSSIYEPWKESYLHYSKLKGLLYEGQSGEAWEERNESRFVEELDSELEKVAFYSIQLMIRFMHFNVISVNNWRIR